MVRCNLAILLAERNLKNSKVSADTGISRATLLALMNNKSQGIYYETINTLCMYLKVTPEQLISFVPIDISIKKVEFINNTSHFKMDLELYEYGIKQDGSLRGCIACTEDIEANSYPLTLLIELLHNENVENNKIINSIKKLPKPFQKDLEDYFLSWFIQFYETEGKNIRDEDFLQLWWTDYELVV